MEHVCSSYLHEMLMHMNLTLLTYQKVESFFHHCVKHDLFFALFALHCAEASVGVEGERSLTPAHVVQIGLPLLHQR